MSIEILQTYLECEDIEPLFLQGDARALLCACPDDAFDCCLTSPPYWQKRDYHAGGIGDVDETVSDGLYCNGTVR